MPTLTLTSWRQSGYGMQHGVGLLTRYGWTAKNMFCKSNMIGSTCTQTAFAHVCILVHTALCRSSNRVCLLNCLLKDWQRNINVRAECRLKKPMKLRIRNSISYPEHEWWTVMDVVWHVTLPKIKLSFFVVFYSVFAIFTTTVARKVFGTDRNTNNGKGNSRTHKQNKNKERKHNN